MVEEVLQRPEKNYRYNAATGNTLAATLTTTLPIILCSSYQWSQLSVGPPKSLVVTIRSAQNLHKAAQSPMAIGFLDVRFEGFFC